MDTTKKVALDLFSTSASNNLQKVVSFFVFLVIMKELTVHDYGVLTLLFSLPGPILVIAGLSMGSLITSEIAKARGANNHSRIARLFFEYYFVKFFIFGVLALFALLFSNYISNYYDIYLLQHFHLLFIFAFFLLIIDFISVLLTGYEKFVNLSLMGALEPFVRLFLLLFLLFTGGFEIKEVFIVYIISKVISSAVGLVFARGIIKDLYSIFHTGEKWVFISVVKKHGKWLMLRDLFSSITDNITPWIIKLFLNTEMVAVFSVAQRIIGVASGAIPFNKISFPLIAKNSHNIDYVNIIIQKFRKYATALAIIFVIGIFITTDIVIGYAFPDYMQSILLIKIMSLKIILNSACLGQKGLLFGLNKQKFQFQLSIYSIIQNNLFNFCFIYFFSLTGLAFSVLANALLLLIIKEIYLLRNVKGYGIKLKHYFRFDSHDKLLLKMFIDKLPYFKSVKNN